MIKWILFKVFRKNGIRFLNKPKDYYIRLVQDIQSVHSIKELNYLCEIHYKYLDPAQLNKIINRWHISKMDQLVNFQDSQSVVKLEINLTFYIYIISKLSKESKDNTISCDSEIS